MPAVIAIASAPQNATRIVARGTFAPPALAPAAGASPARRTAGGAGLCDEEIRRGHGKATGQLGHLDRRDSAVAIPVVVELSGGVVIDDPLIGIGREPLRYETRPGSTRQGARH
jgi:hypothetical protein